MLNENRELRSILATDCGSTTTKAILIEKQNNEYRLIVRGEAPTTVEAPVEDVMRGVINAITEVEELSGRKLLRGEKLIKPQQGNEGVDIYISTSSAGGGLQMMVAGVVRTMTAESAERAALGAGAIVMDVIASNDGRLPHEKINRIRHLRPDMILLSGGVDGGTTSHVAELAEIIAAANPTPRLGIGYQLPIIYAGNKDAQDIIKERLKEKMALEIVENIRPVLERENPAPARLKIQEQFLEHVMAHAPGYKTLISWTDAPIMPTPGAVGSIIQTIAQRQNIQVIGVDIGGATTDVFSVFKNPNGEPIFNRTVSANLGMSYSISNVLAETGLENILRWLPFELGVRGSSRASEIDLRNRIKNKMIRPTTIPQTLEELIIEQAIAREALRLAFEQHKSLARELLGVQRQRTISDAFDQKGAQETLVNMLNVELLVGSGGVLSHAPRRNQAALMLIDAFQPEGITKLAVDSIFMMPQLGVLAQVNEIAAMQVFQRDCLIHLGTCIAPVGNANEGKPCLSLQITLLNGQRIAEEIPAGELRLYPLAVGETAQVQLETARGFELDKERSEQIETEVSGGVVGLIIDTRGRPLEISQNTSNRVSKLLKWNRALNVYPMRET
ncbi:methylaspartate mutase [Candidatus Poribacteria bacterium]|nr:methylaspartate mutase [Candidatus Poribacteria bacterium]